jgi:Concanavalin A-like lectin/glucanases superfamily
VSQWSDAVLALSPSSFWRFESASPLADSGSGGQTLTATGSPSQVPSLVPSEQGVANNAYSLNGTTQYLQAGDVYEFTGEIDWTLSWWLDADDTSGFRRILEKRDATGTFPGWTIYTNDSNAAVTFDLDYGATTEGMTEASSVWPTQTQWRVITWVDSTTSMRQYVNGSLIGTKSSWSIAPGFPSSGTSLFTIGATSSGGDPKADGMIDDVAVWSGTALSGTQIASLWVAGTGVPGAWLAA